MAGRLLAARGQLVDLQPERLPGHVGLPDLHGAGVDEAQEGVRDGGPAGAEFLGNPVLCEGGGDRLARLESGLATEMKEDPGEHPEVRLRRDDRRGVHYGNAGVGVPSSQGGAEGRSPLPAGFPLNSSLATLVGTWSRIAPID
jgi:hypothetical protein